MTRVLIVDDQSGARRSLALLLENVGIESVQAGDGIEALGALENGSFDVVISDLRMDNMSGMELLRAIRCKEPYLPLILVTAYGTVESAVEAMRLGAYDYLTKPFSEKDILEKIHNAQQNRNLAMAPAARIDPRDEIVRRENDDGSEAIIVTGAAMQTIANRIERVARTDLSVLITGETGTGKSRYARNICELSHRASKKFVSINCASLPEQLLESELFGHAKGSFTGATQKRIGLFEEADGGTIFFDEVDTLSQGTQAKLLSVLQDREIRPVGSNRARRVDVRVISAANRNLETLISKGEFRADLYYRLNGIRIHLPPLRERGDDLRILVERLLAKYSKRYGGKSLTMTPTALNLILTYSYPGNIRQLESFVEQMVVFAAAEGLIDADALPEELCLAESPPATDVDLSLGKSERLMIEAALSGNQTLNDVARKLGIGRTTLWRKIRQHNIQRPSAPKPTSGGDEIKSSD